jgi:hypothetical protein
MDTEDSKNVIIMKARPESDTGSFRDFIPELSRLSPL